MESLSDEELKNMLQKMKNDLESQDNCFIKGLLSV